MSNWSPEKSAELYGINNWGNGYFRINGAGNVSVTPMGANGPSVDLFELTQDLLDRGIRVPIMIRFPEIIKSRVELLNGCFQKAFADHGYKGQYRGVYPIKVNQQRHLVQELVKYGRSFSMGLECGSKPELLVVLALMNTENALIICNGFKDFEYIETAILSQKLGRNTIIVVDRKEELKMIVDTAKKFNTRPKIGFRAKLNTQGAGKWVDSSGARSKFGLTAVEIVDGVEYLKKEGMLDCLELLHYHIGSQVPAIQSIKSSLKEGARFYTELYKMGAGLKYIDVGGGLGIDYDGSGHSDSSVNYSEQEYANDIVSVLQTLCDEKGIPHPSIVTESGRFLVAHHSVLVFNVLGVNDLHRHEPPRPASKTDPSIMQDMQYIFEKVNKDNINECFNDLEQAKQETLQLFTYGVLTLEQRAWCESMYFSIATKMVKLAKTVSDTEDIIAALSKELCDTYFSNFSVFQSVPDSWAVGQLFPVIPIHRLGEEPSRETTLADLTCDSDGVIEKFIDTESGTPKDTVRLHQFTDGQQYYLGVFLTGAYQEILGDLHNLFGDTDAVHISLNGVGYTIDHYVPGDTVTEVLSYVQYGRSEMVDNVRQATEESIQKGSITKQEAKLLIKHYEEGLSGYTYLEEAE
ncbi:MAG: arginine decarboxylase [Bdellovibrio sp. ArHS]|uniref:biosynthetic arginine decarboxylase n=1 Tax=Bdellovibrio sp. ArHS TaxID=1569284 RepID=UPI0005831087|nr:biosynthetic arginine decarboxylase [Bdellovibrio sp. ArHS]KHD89007.1 MAG: arginine decarboxylase [Bdellovibrio sp. ArHS]